MKKLGRQTKKISEIVNILSWGAVVGSLEDEGPLHGDFDAVSKDEYFGKATFEEGETQMQKMAVQYALSKGNLRNDDIDILLSGDLLNQCIASTFNARGLQIPYLGIYGACSTMAESLLLGSMLVDGGFAHNILCGTSSHFCTAERQYRMPVAHGNQRPLYAQNTVTGSGMAVVSNVDKPPFITYITIGKIVDLGVSDVNNMGAAMAPAAVDSLLAHFRERGVTPDYYDLIVTGDLGQMGKDIVIELMAGEGTPLVNYNDCGVMIYDLDAQSVEAGGSGCGCSGATLCGHILKKMQAGQLNKVLFVGTGALLSPISSLQGETIPSVAHCVAIENSRMEKER